MSSSLFSVLAQSGTGSDWNWFLIFIVAVVILAIFLILQAKFARKDVAEIEHHAADDHHEVRASHVEESVPVEEEPAPEPEVAAEPEVESQPEESAPTPKTEPEAPAVPDDLRKIEGIGPKVSSLLNENGISTFAQLAETSIEKLDEILDANKLQMMNPKTWPDQAKLAAAGDWEALQKMQDELKGGL